MYSLEMPVLLRLQVMKLSVEFFNDCIFSQYFISPSTKVTTYCYHQFIEVFTRYKFITVYIARVLNLAEIFSTTQKLLGNILGAS